MSVFRSCGQFEPIGSKYLGHMTKFWLCLELKKAKVGLSDESLSRAVNLHLSGLGKNIRVWDW